MASYRIFTLVVVLFLIQATCAKSVEDDTFNFFDSSEEEIRKNPTPAQKLYLYTFDNLLRLGKQFAANAINVSRTILKDESLLANTKPEVLEFKKNLTTLVEKYETNKNPISMWDILNIYSDITDKYTKLPKEMLFQATPETVFIYDILKKYETKDITEEFGRVFSIY